MNAPSVMFIAGDPSGDQHAAPVIRALRNCDPHLRVWGIGGPSMRNEGFEPIMPFAPFNRMGFMEVAFHLRFFLNAKKRLMFRMRQDPPRALVCVDYPGFNMPMMKAAKALDIPVIWYIAPMVWAWKRKRAKVLGNNCTHIGVIFPFETEYFSRYGAAVSYVGNPVVASMEREGRFSKVRDRGKNQERILAIVPGSRTQEIKHLLAPMIGAYTLLKDRVPGLKAVVSRCSLLPMELYKESAGEALEKVEVFDGSLRDMLARADYALVTSGTATLETALMGVPMVLAYKTSWITYAIAKSFVKIPFIGLPNIIAGRQVHPECIQDNVTAPGLAKALLPYIEDPAGYEQAVADLIALRALLASKDPAEIMAGIIKNVITT